MSALSRRMLLLLVLALVAASVPGRGEAQGVSGPAGPPKNEEALALRGVLTPPIDVPASRIKHNCLVVPAGTLNEYVQGPHGDSLVSASCVLVSAAAPGPGVSPSRWLAARYRRTTVFTAEDTTRGPLARDTVPEEEVVLFEVPAPGRVRAVWQARFETGAYAVWRSVTPEVAFPRTGTVLVSVMSCLNGTGGCSQEFLQRLADGRWRPVRQVWFEQLPPGFAGRIRHGTRIDPRTLRGGAGFYADRDPNCCPSQELRLQLALRGDSLVLRGHAFRHLPAN